MDSSLRELSGVLQMPPVRKLWTEEEGLMTIRAWVSPMDLIETNDDLSHEEVVKKMKNYKMSPDRTIMQDDLMCKFRKYETAQEMWLALKDKFGGTSTTKLKRLKIKFDSYWKRQNHTIRQHLREIAFNDIEHHLELEVEHLETVKLSDRVYIAESSSRKALDFKRKRGHKYNQKGERSDPNQKKPYVKKCPRSRRAGKKKNKSKMKCYDCSKLGHFAHPKKQGQLDCSRHYKIIGGMARGILYLHEDSQLRIIYRDLKASNILLDAQMNPKISDFGLSRIFGVDQTQGLEALRDGTPLQLLDSNLTDLYSRDEVNRCIHVGLLCVQEDPADRPSMATIVLVLNSYSVTLPMPR
ncbi:cysteine-rich receptor-like protein kinase 10 [Citrus sinensis]|nr:cysteine-rich receptor-like protein kinase 10 [Citrus sinensis]